MFIITVVVNPLISLGRRLQCPLSSGKYINDVAQVFVIKQQIKELAGYENCHSN